MGTGPYMSPEQVQFVRDDPRSDLFALGVMLYHLTTGRRPFGAPTSVRGLRQRLYRAPVAAARVCAPSARHGCRKTILRIAWRSIRRSVSERGDNLRSISNTRSRSR
jgi:serine/threonine protein kinase